MKVEEIMTSPAKWCTPETNLAAVAMLMWDGDCGVIPVISDERITGVITDRDICIALATKHRRAEEIMVSEVAQGPIVTCALEDDIHKALNVMSEHKIRRVPVVNSEGQLAGILSMNDIVLVAQETRGRRGETPTFADVVNVFKAICAHRERALAA